LETSSELQNSTLDVNERAPVPLKERLMLALKFALVGIVFYYLYRKGLITTASFQKMAASPKTLMICSVLMFLNTLFGALRWQVLLKSQGADLRFLQVLKLNMVGAFFNIALPGAVSGDFVKAVHVAKMFKDKRAAIFGSMLFDRILGVSAMVFVAAFSALLSVFLPWGGSLPSFLLIAVGVVGFANILFFIYLFLSHKRDPLFELLKFFTKRSEKLSAVDRLYQGVMVYRKHPSRILKAIGVSVMIHLFLVLIAFFITEAISADSLSVIAVAVIAPIGMLATTLPVLPAGVGTGHAAFYALYHLVGSSLGAEVFSMIVLYQVLVGAIGGVVYLKVLSEK
jgi:hypothetical protein